ncbi:MAG: nuclear transport factor 2 family protein [Saprospiraceae bacterium]|nr:nuclear transport factor 2 family protein [Saprospiraceae bacterium]
MIQRSLTLLAFFVLPTVGQAQTKAIEEVKSILIQQSVDWNKGDIDAFMEYYWKSDELQFIGSSGVIKGWQATLERYQRTYPDRDAMGQLTFDVLEVHQLSRKVIMLTGKYTLERKNDRPTGYFILMWKKMKGKWLIVADHTSASA